MIHIDMNKGIMEYEGNGEELIRDIVAVLYMTLRNLKEEHDIDDIKSVGDMICGTIQNTLRHSIDAIDEIDEIDEIEEGAEYEDEAWDIQEERNREDVPAQIKKFRRAGRNGRRITS